MLSRSAALMQQGGSLRYEQIEKIQAIPLRSGLSHENVW